jgi:hypothetical protein
LPGDGFVRDTAFRASDSGCDVIVLPDVEVELVEPEALDEPDMVVSSG